MSDDSSSSARFAKLNDTNYASWAMQMEAELIRKGLWVDVTEVMIEQLDDEGKQRKEEEITMETETKLNSRSTTKMAQARAEMILRVEPGQLAHMRNKDPLAVWEDLKAVHRARGFAAFLSLKRKFLTMKKGKSQKMSAWIGEVKSQAFDMQEAGLEVPDLDIILALTMGLPSSYDSLIIDHVTTRLLAEETRQLTRTSVAGAATETTITPNHTLKRFEHALSATTKTPLPVDKITCWFCEEKGHYKDDCPKRKKWIESQNEKALMAEKL
jgi:hypothetical protein